MLLLLAIQSHDKIFSQINSDKLQKHFDSLNASKTVTIKADTHFFELPEGIMPVTEVFPIFPGGDKALISYILQNTNYPSSAIKDSIEGSVILRFAVDVDGCISDIMALKSVRSDLDSECIRVIKNMPQWKPGMAVKSSPKGLYWTPDKMWYSVPFYFSFKNSENKKGIIIRPGHNK